MSRVESRVESEGQGLSLCSGGVVGTMCLYLHDRSIIYSAQLSRRLFRILDMHVDSSSTHFATSIAQRVESALSGSMMPHGMSAFRVHRPLSASRRIVQDWPHSYSASPGPTRRLHSRIAYAMARAGLLSHQCVGTALAVHGRCPTLTRGRGGRGMSPAVADGRSGR